MPDKGTVEIWYAVVGEGTERLSQMQPGSTSTLLGPGGHGWTVPGGMQEGAARRWRHRRSAGALPGSRPCFQRHRLRCLHRARLASAGSMVGVEEFNAAGAGKVLVATDDGSAGYHQGSARTPPLSFWRLAAMTTLPRAAPAP